MFKLKFIFIQAKQIFSRKSLQQWSTITTKKWGRFFSSEKCTFLENQWSKDFQRGQQLFCHLTPLKLAAARIQWSIGHPTVASDLLCYLQSSFTCAAFGSKIMSIPGRLFVNILEGFLPASWSYVSIKHLGSRYLGSPTPPLKRQNLATDLMYKSSQRMKEISRQRKLWFSKKISKRILKKSLSE